MFGREVEVEREEARTGVGNGEEGENQEGELGPRMTGGRWSRRGVQGGGM